MEQSDFIYKTPDEVSGLLRKVADAIDRNEIPFDPAVLCYVMEIRTGDSMYFPHVMLSIRFQDFQPGMTKLAHEHGVLFQPE